MHFVAAPVTLVTSGDIHICLTANKSHGNAKPNRTRDKWFPVTDDYKHFHQFLLIVLTLTRRLTCRHSGYEQENRERQTFLHVCVHRGLYVNTRARMQFHCVEDQTSDLPVPSSPSEHLHVSALVASTVLGELEVCCQPDSLHLQTDSRLFWLYFIFYHFVFISMHQARFEDQNKVFRPT